MEGGKKGCTKPCFMPASLSNSINLKTEEEKKGRWEEGEGGRESRGDMWV
jgi:hypothetical protein